MPDLSGFVSGNVSPANEDEMKKQSSKKDIELAKHRKLMVLLLQAGMDDEARHDMIYAYTNGRTSSSRCLTDFERNDLIWKLENDFMFRSSPSQVAANAIRKRRSIVLTIAQRCGIHSGTDFKRFNSFMLEKSILKKRLNEYTLCELDELINQFRGLERNFERSAINPGTKAWSQKHGFAGVGRN